VETSAIAQSAPGSPTRWGMLHNRILGRRDGRHVGERDCDTIPGIAHPSWNTHFDLVLLTLLKYSRMPNTNLAGKSVIITGTSFSPEYSKSNLFRRRVRNRPRSRKVLRLPILQNLNPGYIRCLCSICRGLPPYRVPLRHFPLQEM
jgi:hypothetical protein